MLHKKWKDIGYSGKHIPPQKKAKYAGKRDEKGLSGKKKLKKEIHHVWLKPYRNSSSVCRKNDIKKVDFEEHDVWNKMTKKAHPKVAFTRIINLCIGKTRATEDEKECLAILAGFDWQKDPNAAIVAIFEKFMPDELGEMIVPYLVG